MITHHRFLWLLFTPHQFAHPCGPAPFPFINLTRTMTVLSRPHSESGVVDADVFASFTEHSHSSRLLLLNGVKVSWVWYLDSMGSLRSGYGPSVMMDDVGQPFGWPAAQRKQHMGGIRSNTMSHITLKMCQFVLIIHLRDYHYDFDLDIVIVWSCYGVLRLTYTTYQNSCPTDHFFRRLLMSQDISPTWIVLLESIYWIIQIFFCIFPMSKIVL